MMLHYPYTIMCFETPVRHREGSRFLACSPTAMWSVEKISALTPPPSPQAAPWNCLLPLPGNTLPEAPTAKRPSMRWSPYPYPGRSLLANLKNVPQPPQGVITPKPSPQPLPLPAPTPDSKFMHFPKPLAEKNLQTGARQ